MKKSIAAVLLFGLAASTQAASFTIDGVSYTGDCVSAKGDDGVVISLQCVGRPAGTATVGTAPAPTVTVTRGSRVVDASGTPWTLGAGNETLRNGAQVGGGYGSEYLLVAGTVYVRGSSGAWYRWSGSQWVLHGTTEPK